MKKSARRAFTLIELLIVVAIIAILAAIAVPNFLEAQVRSKASRVKADMRSLRTAIETYYIDYNKYPMYYRYYSVHSQQNRGRVHQLFELTTPVAYMSSVEIVDPFCNVPHDTVNQYGDTFYSIWYESINPHRAEGGLAPVSSPLWGLASYGPDFRPSWPFGGMAFCLRPDDPESKNPPETWTYDPTNGTRSAGDIIMYQ